MDPRATLRMIDEKREELRLQTWPREVDYTEVNALCQELANWLDGGGFAPVWAEFPTGTAYFILWLIYSR